MKEEKGQGELEILRVREGNPLRGAHIIQGLCPRPPNPPSKENPKWFYWEIRVIAVGKEILEYLGLSWDK